MAAVALSTFDPARALALFQREQSPNSRAVNGLRVELAEKLFKSDPAAAEALVEAVTDQAMRAQGLVSLANALPASSSDRKRDLLERAAPMVRGLPENLAKIAPIAALAEAWLDLHEAEKARTLLREGLKPYDTITNVSQSSPSFLRQLMRVSPSWHSHGFRRSGQRTDSCRSPISPPR